VGDPIVVGSRKAPFTVSEREGKSICAEVEEGEEGDQEELLYICG